jgi:hypothetical protein
MCLSISILGLKPEAIHELLSNFIISFCEAKTNPALSPIKRLHDPAFASRQVLGKI